MVHEAAADLNGQKPDFTIARRRRAWLLISDSRTVLLFMTWSCRVPWLRKSTFCARRVLALLVVKQLTLCGIGFGSARTWLDLTALQEWFHHFRNPEQSCFWLRGLVPSHWAVKVDVSKEDRVVEGLLAQPWPVSPLLVLVSA